MTTEARCDIGIIMGSQSDWETMRHAADTLDRLGVAYETRIVSAHRTPDRLYEYARSAQGRGLKAIIAGAGGAAHLPGMAAAMTTLPVLGVPVESRTLRGVDSLLSIVQMPAGVPVATFAIGQAGAVNAALFAAAILALADPKAAAALAEWRRSADRCRRRASGDRESGHRYSGQPMMLPPGSTIGILGGGQLGRMTALAAARLGYRTHIFVNEPDSPAVQVSAAATIAPFGDAAALARFAAAVDVATCEFENVPAAALRRVAAKRPVLPRPEIIEIAQDRLREKTFLRSIGVATAEFRAVDSPAALDAALRELGRPAVLKTVRLGYDGKGQVMLDADTEAEEAWRRMGAPHGILEGFVDFACEISVVAGARRRRRAGSLSGGREPPRQPHPRHHGRAGPRSRPRSRPRPMRIARHIAERLDLVGVLAVEMFVTRRGRSSSTSWRRGRTIPATGRSTPASPASSSSWCARSAACRSARPSATRTR